MSILEGISIADKTVESLKADRTQDRFSLFFQKIEIWRKKLKIPLPKVQRPRNEPNYAHRHLGNMVDGHSGTVERKHVLLLNF